MNFKQIFREVNNKNLVGVVILNYLGRAYVWQILCKWTESSQSEETS